MLDFDNLQKYRENNRIEAKEALGGLPESIWETYSAFANTQGGMILLGVEELPDKRLHALDILDPQWLLEDFWKLINDPNTVSVNILTEENVQVRRVDGKQIIAITVPQAQAHQRPVYIENDVYRGSYRRCGEGDYRLTREEVDAMLEAGRREKKMEKILVVVDMQNDFIDGTLGTPEAQAIVPYVRERIESFEGKVFFTRDTHFENYMDTQEGRNLPVPHCIRDTPGWQIREELEQLRKTAPIDKLTFGSRELVQLLQRENPESITFLGLCTDICVISNALVVKAFFPEIPLTVDARGCAGVTPQSHKNALEAMKMCQIQVINEK